MGIAQCGLPNLMQGIDQVQQHFSEKPIGFVSPPGSPFAFHQVEIDESNFGEPLESSAEASRND
ncbi:hypothetical protein, partial [Pseudomonas sp.]|uniref:hypothetical protein n=1 Tax=Pseudomonas sp. TaxID=306 RepID=UPI002618BA70